MHRLRVCLPLSLMFVWITASVASADEPPDPPKIQQPPPPPPPEPAKAEPAKTEPAKTEPAKTEPAKAVDAKKTESGGMCRVDGSAGAWPLLALLGLAVGRRRRGS